MTRVLGIVMLAALAAGCSGDGSSDGAFRSRAESEPDNSSRSESTTMPAQPIRRGSYEGLIPRPLDAATGDGEFLLTEATRLVIVEGASADGAAELLQGYLGPATGLNPQLDDVRSSGAIEGAIVFTSDGASGLGSEGYEIHIESERVEVVAEQPAGFGWAVQTLRQLLPPGIEGAEEQPGTWALPAGSIRDAPRFEWRGAMLDVARHFFSAEDVKSVVDLLAAYKMNRLHLHLSDDQGWRIAIAAHPELTEIGARTEVGGGPGGFYTQDEYREVVDYAAERGVIVVPEIDMPGHTNAALVSIPELNCDGVPPEPYTGMSVGFSSLCIGKEETYEFVDAVVGELAALTPGPYIHIGGDEADATAPADYRLFIERAAGIVRSHGKTPVGWDEIAQAEIGHDAVVQHWRSEANARAAASKGAGVVMSPAPRAYLDMKYDESSPIGNTWAGHIDTETAYAWDPATHVPDLPVDAVVGVEAPLWTEFVTSRDEIELMMLPRLPGYAEVGWSAPGNGSWNEYRHRLALHADRWTAAGRTFTADPGVPWPTG